MSERSSAMIFNVQDYGAVPGGEPATAAIQRAMDDAAKVCGIVEIPAGRWACGCVHVPAGIEVRGTYTWNWSHHLDFGFAGTILELCDESAPCMFDMSDARGTAITGLSMNGKRLGDGIHGIYVGHDALSEADDGIRLENVKVAFFTGDSVCLRYVRGFFVHHSMLCFSTGWSLSVIGRDVFVIDNWFSGSHESGNFALLGDAENIMLSANRIEDPYKDAYNVNLYAPRTGDPTVGARNVSIVNNYLCGASSCGVSAVAQGDAVLSGISIIGNVFDSNGSFREPIRGTHVTLSGCFGCLVSQNTLFTKRGFWDPDSPINTAYGITVADCTEVLVAENAIDDCAECGAVVDLGGHSGNVVLLDNAGREVCHVEGYMFPYWNNEHFPDAKRDDAALALSDL